jgi:hypothetical protein
MWGARFWPIWLSIGFGVGITMEIVALATNPRNTLSYWVWTTLQSQRNVDPWNWTATQFLTLGLWLVIVVWLTFHFWFHRFT